MEFTHGLTEILFIFGRYSKKVTFFFQNIANMETAMREAN